MFSKESIQGFIRVQLRTLLQKDKFQVPSAIYGAQIMLLNEVWKALSGF